MNKINSILRDNSPSMIFYRYHIIYSVFVWGMFTHIQFDFIQDGINYMIQTLAHRKIGFAVDIYQ